MDERVISNTIIRLYAVMDDLSYCIYDTFLNHYDLGRKEYGKVTLLEFYIYSLFVMNKFIERYEFDDILYIGLLNFTQNKGVEKFSGYLNSEKDLHNRYNNYERYYLNDQIRDLNNLSILCEDYALKSEGMSLLKIKSCENEDSHSNSSHKTDFTDEIIQHSLLLKKAAQEIISYRTQYESDDVIWGIRKNYENKQLFIGGAELITHISRDSPTPLESNPVLMQLLAIKAANDIKCKDIARVDEVLYNAIKNCYESDEDKSMTDEMLASYFDTMIILNGNIEYTKAELIQCLLEYSITGLQSTIATTMNFNDKIISDITNNLSKNDLKLVDYLLNVFYPEYLKGEYSQTGIDETYSRIFNTIIYDNLKILFGDYVYFEIDDIDNLSTYFSIIDFYEEKGKSNTITNIADDDDDDDLFQDEDIFEDDVELYQSDDIEDLYSYGKVFFHLMSMYFYKESEKNHTFPSVIKKQSVFNSLKTFILHIENFKHVTPEIIDFFKITKNRKILYAINDNQGVGYLNLMSELSFRLEHMDKETNYFYLLKKMEDSD